MWVRQSNVKLATSQAAELDPEYRRLHYRIWRTQLLGGLMERCI